MKEVIGDNKLTRQLSLGLTFLSENFDVFTGES